MARFAKIFVMFAVIQLSEIIVCTPLFQGISISKNFEIALKRLKIRPLTYITEKWGPFGTFGRKHAITKRQTVLDIISQSEPIVNQEISNINSRVTTLTPPPVPLIPVLPPGMNTAVSVPPALPLHTDITRLTDRSPAPVYEINPSEPPHPPHVPMNIPFASINNRFVSPTISNEIVGSTPSAGFPPRIIPVGPLNPPPAAAAVPSPAWTVGLNTPRQPVFDNDPFRVNLITPPTPAPTTVPSQVPPETTQRRGIFARLFGDFFLTLLSRFLNNARASINPVPNSSTPIQ